MATALGESSNDLPERGRGAIPYQPALDGIRAFAVGAVLVYHSQDPGAVGGFLGVDAFFVLSGYLITTLLITEWAREQGIALRAFWARRARRLLPALFLVLTFVAIFPTVLVGATGLESLRADGIASLGYVTNWRFVFSGQSYFDQFGAPSPLRHLWSLAIEEQFYLVWPMIVWGVLRWRRGSTRALLVVSVALGLGSAALMAALHHPGEDPSRVYYGTDTRAQSLLVGAVIAIVLARHGPIRSTLARVGVRLAACVGAVYTLWAWSRMSESTDWLYEGGFLLGAVAVGAVIVSVVQPHGGVLAWVLSLSPIRWVGKISYGLYLWHWPVYLWLTPGRVGLEGRALLIARIAVSVAIASVSYYLVELPIRRGALRQWRAWTLAPAAAGVIVVALALTTQAGESAALDLLRRAPTSAPSPSPPSPSPDSAVRPPVRVLVQGDSVAWFLAEGLVQHQRADGLVVWNRARWGCSLGFGTSDRVGPSGVVKKCDDWHRVWGSEVRRFRPDVAVVLLGVFEIFDRDVNGRHLEFGSPAFDDYYLRLIDDASRVLSARGAHVVFLLSPHPLRSTSMWESHPEWAPDEAWRTRHYGELVRRAAARHPVTISVIDLADRVCPGGTCAAKLDGVLLRGDGVHWTEEGATILARWLGPKLRAAGVGSDVGSGVGSDVNAS